MTTPSNVKPFDNRIVAIHTGVSSYLDHLGVLAILLDLPLIVTDPQVFQDAKRFYPELRVTYMDPSELSLPFLAQNFDVILSSGHYWAVELIPLLKLFCNKEMRVIYCPHGNSDKGWSRTKPLLKDLSFVYGPQMLEHLDNLSGYIVTGNYRYPYYLQRKAFYDELLTQALNGRLDPSRKTLLYAPTWNDPENPTTFFTDCEKLLRDVGPRYNVIVKLHPFLSDDHPIEVEQMIHRFKNVVFLLNFPPIYPVLDFCDAYVGDYSSIGYDFLTFDRPLFFLAQNRGFLNEAGLTLPSHAILQFIEENWNKDFDRRRVYYYAFSKKKDVNVIREEMERALLCAGPKIVT